jgi:iron complex transport system ATP-binding protein
VADDTGAAELFELDGASFAVDGRRLVEPLTLSIPVGHFIGLIGHNGSGKSTLLKLLARQQAASGGTISLAGKPVREWGDRAFARMVGYLPQNPPASTGLTVRELVALGRYPWHGALGRFGAADRDKVTEALAFTGMDHLANRLVDTLSGGERQRAWMAMLVAQDTRCLLLDEPISALDIAHQIEILAMVRRLSRARNIGVVAVLHDVNMAARFCDEIAALHTGRLIAKGRPTDIMQSAPLERIYGIPMGTITAPETCDLLCYPR